jgi:hypothetical protein
VVVLERRAHVHALESLELLETLDTAPNARGVCALTVCAQPCLLVLPSSGAGGALRIHNLLAGSGGGVLSEVAAHRAHVVRARACGQPQAMPGAPAHAVIARRLAVRVRAGRACNRPGAPGARGSLTARWPAPRHGLQTLRASGTAMHGGCEATPCQQKAHSGWSAWHQKPTMHAPTACAAHDDGTLPGPQP